MVDIEQHNFLLCNRGFSYTGNALKPYTENILKDLHEHIYTQLAGLAPCTERCSETHGRVTKRWCVTCKKWKDALQKEHRKAYNIKWQKTHSWTWPTSQESIVEVFVPLWTITDYNLQDISILCYIWTKCKHFKLNSHLCDWVASLRNKHCGHNVNDARVSDNDKSKVFDVLKDLCKDGEVVQHVDQYKCNEDLSKIEKSKDSRALLCEITKDVNCLRAETHANFELLKKVALGCLVVICFVVFCYVFIKSSNDIGILPQPKRTGDDRISIKGCVSEVYSYPFQQDLPLIEYLTHHQKLVGREWLFDEIEKAIFDKNHAHRGFILGAEMGFGKSAIIRHVLCAEGGQKGSKIRSNIAAFHVCKFDVPSTWKVERFIRRLMGFFSRRSAEFGSEISQLNNHSLIFNIDTCAKEPVACLDQGIISPLKKINIDGTWVIAIDALDECMDSDTNKNSVLDLLSRRIRDFPNWIKFFISTRHKYDEHIMRKLKKVYIKYNDSRNVNDIESYLAQQSLLRETENDVKGLSLKAQYIQKIMTQSEGSFLFVTHALQFIMSTVNEMEVTLPTSLTDIYEINFQRMFRNPSNFHVAKMILEIICTSIHPLSELDIIKVLQANNITNDGDISESFQNLSDFLNQDDVVRIVHQSLRDWLVDEKNTIFHISTKAGHRYVSRYLIKSLNANDSIDFATLAIHVAHSNDEDIIGIFKSLKIQQLKTERSFVHKLIWRSNSVVALKLVLPYLNDIDLLNEGGASPAFIAAARGHTEQLKLLVDRGANISIVLNAKQIQTPKSADVFMAIELMENKYFLRHNLLHIATKFGHKHTVRFLLQTQPSLIYHLTSMGYLPSDIACESGNIDILLEMLAVNNGILKKKCVYLALKNGHENIIEVVFGRKMVHLTCITDSESFNAYRIITKYFDKLNLAPELWRLVLQETVMHVAVKHGHTHLFKRLLLNYSHLLDCKDVYGMTPLLASVWYNQIDIFKLLTMRLNHSSERCSENRPYFISDFREKQGISHVFSLDKFCPRGSSFPHIVAMFNRVDMLDFVLKNRMFVNWTSVDTDLNYADHYAACAGSLDYLHLAKKSLLSHNIEDLRSANGSTVYHVAAMCANTASISILKGVGPYFRIPQYTDHTNRTILHYSVLKRPENDSIDSHINTIRIVNTLLADGHSLLDVDADGRNILHYAFLNGYYSVSQLIYDLDRQVWNKLTTQVDNAGYTPTSFSISHNTNDFRPTYIDTHFESLESIPIYLQPTPQWEKTIFLAILKIGNCSSCIAFPTTVYHDLFSKSAILTNLMLVNLTPDDESLQRELLTLLDKPISFNDIFSYSLLILYSHRPAIFHACNRHLDHSPLHKIALNRRQSEVIFSDTLFFAVYVDRQILTKFLTCPDSYGYNVFHYAIIGGNIQTAKLLLEFGVNITNTRVKHEDILWMALLSRIPQSENCTILSDEFLSNFVKEYQLQFKTQTFCKNGTKELSLMHILSFNGMTRTMQTILEIYGNDLLFCKNKDGFVPHFMYLMYDREGNLSEIFGRNGNISYPEKTAEVILYFNLAFAFPTTHDTSLFKSIFSRKENIWYYSRNRRTLNERVKYFAMAFEVRRVQVTNVGEIGKLKAYADLLDINIKLINLMEHLKSSRHCEYHDRNYTMFIYSLHNVSLSVTLEYADTYLIQTTRRLLHILASSLSGDERVSSCLLPWKNRRSVQHLYDIISRIIRKTYYDFVNRLILFVYRELTNTLMTKGSKYFNQFTHDRMELLGFKRKQTKMSLAHLIFLSKYDYKYLNVVKYTVLYKCRMESVKRTPHLYTDKLVFEKGVSPLFDDE